jgi:hypothetical protein
LWASGRIWKKDLWRSLAFVYNGWTKYGHEEIQLGLQRCSGIIWSPVSFFFIFVMITRLQK